VAVSSAGPYSNLHLAPDNHASTPPLSFLTGRMPFLSPNQQRQSTEGKQEIVKLRNQLPKPPGMQPGIVGDCPKPG